MSIPTMSVAHTSVGIWIRVSTDDQAKGDSPEHHLERAKLYAKAKNFDVREVYDLAGVSGKSVKEHPEAKRMLADVKRGHIKGLIFSKLARFARNTKELLEFADHFQQHGAALVSLDESIDTSTPAGRLFYTVIAAMAQWEREEIGARVRSSIGIRAKLGKPISGSCPYGFTWKDKKLVQHPTEAAIRREAYELFLKLRRKGAVARELNKRGYRTRNGRLWLDSYVTRILEDTSAKGIYVQNRTKRVGNWKAELKPESEWGVVRVEPIVSEAIWNEVNRIVEEQRKAMVRPGKRPKHIFAGKLRCKCGRSMYVLSATPKYFCEGCRTRIPIVDLEAIFLDQLKAFFANPERIAGHIRKANQAVSERQQLLETSKSEVAKVKEQMARTHQLYLDQAIDIAGFKELYAPQQERLRQLQDDAVRVQSDLDLCRVDSLSTETVVSEALDLQKRWPSLGTEEKRRVVESIVESIIVDKDAQEINITLSCIPTSEETANSQQMFVTDRSCSLQHLVRRFGSS